MNIAAVINNMGNASIQNAQSSNTQNSQAFGNVFGQLLSNQQVQQPAQALTNNSVQLSIVQDLLAVLDTESIEELEMLLDSSDLTVNLKDLRELLNCLDSESDESTDSDVWDLLAGINEQASKLIEAIVVPTNEDSSKQVNAKQAIEMLKIAQLIGNKSDLTIKQESTLFDLHQLLGQVKEALKSELLSKQKPGALMTSNLQMNEVEDKLIIPARQLNTNPFSKQVDLQIITKQVSTSAETVIETKEVTTNVQGQLTSNVQTKVETVSIHLPTEKPGQSEEFTKELQKWMNRVQFGQAGGANRLVIKLYPEHLGTVRIELSQKDGVLTTKMLASTALGKELLDSNSSQLRQSFANQNILIDKLEITQALQDTARQERNQTFQESFREQQQQEHQEHQETNKEESEEPIDFDDFLKGMEV